MAQTQLFVSREPAREGEQGREQPLRVPDARLCHPDPMTFTSVLGHSLQPQLRGPGQGPLLGRQHLAFRGLGWEEVRRERAQEIFREVKMLCKILQ